MTSSRASHAALAWPPAVTPYLGVRDARRALDWYVDVFAARHRGDPHVLPDGTIGHAELAIGDAVLMLAEHPDVGAPDPSSPGGFQVFVQVPDADATVDRAVAAGAELVRPTSQESYGRSGVIVDPFGHRWMVLTPPASAVRAARSRHGDVGYLSVSVPDPDRAKRFFGEVLGWSFVRPAGSTWVGWGVEDVEPMLDLTQGQPAGVQPCFRVDGIDAAVQRVRELGGMAQEPAARPYGRVADCVDDQGLRFQPWEPAAP